MKIKVGSKNQVKINAVKELIDDYEILKNAEVEGVDIDSGVSDQPKGLDETIQGAKNRAQGAFQNCDLAVGLESGIFPVSGTKTGYMDTTVCAIYDGKEFHLGLSSCFEYPVEVTKLVLEKGIEIDEAVYEAGITDNKVIGKAEGMIGYLTKGRVKRVDYTKQAVQMALIHLENRELYV